MDNLLQDILGRLASVDRKSLLLGLFSALALYRAYIHFKGLKVGFVANKYIGRRVADSVFSSILLHRLSVIFQASDVLWIPSLFGGTLVRNQDCNQL